MRTFIPPQKKHTEEKIEVRVEAHIAVMLKEYAEFLESPAGYVVTEILRKAFRKDKAFAQWKQGREAKNEAARARLSRKQSQGDSVPAVAGS